MASKQEKVEPGLLRRVLPVASWLPAYRGSWLAPDILAGITIWAILVPEALAYAEIAGVPVQYGLYAAPLALLAYAVFGGSRRLVLGPSSTAAIVSAAVVAPLAASGSDRFLSLTIALALMVGVLLLAAGIIRLGFIASFLAKPVLKGFITGLAFTIAVGQSGKLFGVHLSGGTALQQLISLFRGAGDWTLLPIVVGAGCLALLFIFSRFFPKVPAAIIALVAATLLAFALDLGGHGLALVGTVPRGLPGWSLSGIALEDLYHLLPGALALALIVYTESIAVAKTDANKYKYEINPNQEMVACGISNIGAGLFQGFTVSGSLSRTAADEAAGGKSQIAALVCAVLTFLTMLFLTGLFKYLPEATLAAIVMHALWHYFDITELARYFRVRKSDFILSLASLLGVILFGVMPGILAAILLSLIFLLQRVSHPNSAVLGRKPGGTYFSDIKIHPDYETIPGILIYRFDAVLAFPNAERFSSEARHLVSEADPPARVLILDFEMISDMDTTASDQFTILLSELEEKGVTLYMARVHQAVCSFMEKDGLVEKIGRDNIFPRVMDAVASAERVQ